MDKAKQKNSFQVVEEIPIEPGQYVTNTGKAPVYISGKGWSVELKPGERASIGPGGIAICKKGKSEVRIEETPTIPREYLTTETKPRSSKPSLKSKKSKA